LHYPAGLFILELTNYYPMTTTEKLHLEIDKQINAGFQSFEIKQNLQAQNFSAAEIEQAFKNRNISAKQSSSKNSSQTSVISLLVSVFFIISGSMRMSKAPSGSMLYTWGIILICVGIAGVIWKSIDLAKR